MNEAQKQRIRDPVHGLIVFGGKDKHRNETDRIAWALLNTREFQRLRRIRQLGFSDLVHPGATHSRFAHSIGVYQTARRLVDVIARQQGEQYDHYRAHVALLAALLHDIGHGPFSHAFEAAATAAGLSRRHEEWSAEIIQGDTEVNHVLREVDGHLPGAIGALLKEEDPKDIFAAVVSSQFDADRLDYIQRDRLMAGVEFGHFDSDWLFDCLEVGSITIGEETPYEAPCLFLGPKGVQVAEEYLEARYRLYRMVYMHKTTRSAEKMLEALLKTAASDLKDDELAKREPVLRYFVSSTLDTYLALDDASVWAALAIYAECGNPVVSKLARRLRNRNLYKCVAIGVRDSTNGNLYLRFRRMLKERSAEENEGLLFDDSTVMPYRWYDFDDASALNKVLVKTRRDMNEPKDIAEESSIVKALQGRERIQRVYAPDSAEADDLTSMLKEVDK